jgi:hypothetical protein
MEKYYLFNIEKIRTIYKIRYEAFIDSLFRLISSGVPTAITLPLFGPPSGSNSIK